MQLLPYTLCFPAAPLVFPLRREGIWVWPFHARRQRARRQTIRSAGEIAESIMGRS